MNLRIATAVAAAALAAAVVMPAAASANPKPPMERAPVALGLTTDMRLVEFPVDQPSKTQAIGKVTGLDDDTKILAIDFRVQDGRLYEAPRTFRTVVPLRWDHSEREVGCRRNAGNLARSIGKRP
ncbi:hypothetical protein ACTVZO_43305 [Streptomyces sp. IBSNAI002]|uniref:hypothetical protein n=1 Tax=Streptomyces sp. IBSNAI002 TaxID=3457500 RepID=UPI003FD40C9E